MLERREVGPVLVAALLLASVVVADLLTGDDTVLVSLLVTPPLLVAAFARPAVTGAVGVVAAALAVALLPAPVFDTPNHLVRVAAIVAGSSLAVLIAARREQRERALVQMTVIADVAQSAVLWPVPVTVGDLSIAARYVSATSAARIGGDLYEVAETEHGVRLIVGDVRGKGLPAVRLASAVLGCFREVAHSRVDLPAVQAALEATVRRVAGPEEFVTAVLLEINAGGLSLVSCGHPAPVLVHGPDVHELPLADPGLPLGLGDGVATPTAFAFPPGSRLLLYTDGLLEGRDDSGAFFCLLEQVDALRRENADACADELLAGLRGHCGGRIADDVALLVLDRRPRIEPPSPALAPADQPMADSRGLGTTVLPGRSAS